MKRSLALVLVAAIAMPAFAQVVYHGSARIDLGGGARANEVFLFDAAGNLTGSYEEITGARTDVWGYRDGAFDGSSVYFGWGGGVARHDADGSNGQLLFGGGGPNGTWRALAYDPTGDNGNGSLWSASFGSSLVEVSLGGNILTTWPANGQWSLYGLSYDDSDGNLWGHTGGGEVIKIDTSTGLLTGAGWLSGFPSGTAQGGLSGYSELGGNLAAVMQTIPDQYGVYDTAAGVPGSPGTFVLGPIDMEGQTGTNGHLGIAVVPEPATLTLLGLGAAALLRRRR